jgi:hypothetical protein
MSTLKVNTIEPYSGGTVTITGATIESASYATTASYALNSAPQVSASYAETANTLTAGDKTINGILTNNGSLIVNNGNVVQDKNDGSNTHLIQNTDHFSTGYGNRLSWSEPTGISELILSENTKVEMILNAWPSGGAFDNSLQVKSDVNGTTLSDWAGSWLNVPEAGNPSFKRDLEVVGTITPTDGKGLDLIEYAGVGSPSYIRFYSGSNKGTNYINMQNEPTGNGRVTISSFPANNHFIFFDPKDGGAGNHRTYIESIVEGGGYGGLLKVGAGIQVTGSTLVSNGNVFQDNSGANSHISQNNDFFTTIYGNNINWKPGDGTSQVTLSENVECELILNAWPSGGAFDNLLSIKSNVNGTSFNDWAGSWMSVPEGGNPTIQRSLKLQQQDPLPTGAVGELAVSGSSLYFHNGTSWSLVV